MKRDLQRLLRRIAAEPGWTVRLCGSGHRQVRGPGVLVHCSGTPSGHVALVKIKAEFRRAGVPERLITQRSRS